MEKTLTLDMVTPERSALSAQAEFVVLPAWGGEMGILPGHAPFLVQLKPGEVRVTEGGAVRAFAISGGFAEIRDNRVELFAETAEMAEQIDEERSRQSLELAKATVSRKDIDSLTLAAAEAAMRRAQVRLGVARRRKPRPPQEGG